MLCRTLFLFTLLIISASGLQLGVRDFRFIHAVSSGGPVDVWINDQLAFSNQGFQSVTEYVQRIEDCETTTVSLVPAGNTANSTIVSVCFDTPKTTSYTLIWRLNAFGAPVLVPTPSTECCAAATRVTPTFSAIEFINLDASHTFPYVSVTKNDGQLFPSVNLNSITAYTELPSGSVAFKFVGPNSAVSFSANLQPSSNYALVLWGGPNFPPVVTLTKLRSCNPKAIPLPTPPVPPPAIVTFPIAWHVFQRSNDEWVTAITTFLQSASGDWIDSYFLRWAHGQTLFNGVFAAPIPGSVSLPVNLFQAAAGVRTFFSGVTVGSQYGQGQAIIRVLDELSFVVQVPYFLVDGSGLLSRGLIHQSFALLPNKTFTLTSFSHFAAPPPPPAVTSVVANNISAMYLSGLRAAFSNSISLSQFYMSWSLPLTIFSPIPYYFEGCVVNPDDPAISACASNANGFALLGAYSGPQLDVTVTQAVHILNPDSFLLVFYGLPQDAVASTAAVFFQQVVFTRQRDLPTVFKATKITHIAGATAVRGGDEVLNGFNQDFENFNLLNLQNYLDGVPGSNILLPYASPLYFQGFVATEFNLILPSLSKEQENLEVLYRLAPYVGKTFQVRGMGSVSTWLTPLSFMFSMAFEMNPQNISVGLASYRGHLVMIWSQLPTPLAVSRNVTSLRVRSQQPPLINICTYLGPKSYSCADQTALQTCTCLDHGAPQSNVVPVGGLLVANIPTGVAADCAAICCYTPQCDAWTTDGQSCSLISEPQTLSASASSTVTGVVTRPRLPCNSSAVFGGVVFDAGSYYAAFTTPTSDQCSAACCGDYDCQGWNWFPSMPLPIGGCGFNSTCCTLSMNSSVTTPAPVPVLGASIDRPAFPSANQCAALKKRTKDLALLKKRDF